MAVRLEAHAAGARSADHLSADVTGDGTADLLVAIVGTDEVFSVTLATWDGSEFVDRGRVTASAPDRVGTPAVRDLDGDGRAEVLAPFASAAGVGVLVATVSDDTNLALPAACPLPAPVPHRLRMRAVDTPDVLLVCRSADAADASTPVLRWSGRHFTADPVGPRPEKPEEPGRGDDPPGRGRGPDGHGPPGRDGRG